MTNIVSPCAIKTALRDKLHKGSEDGQLEGDLLNFEAGSTTLNSSPA